MSDININLTVVVKSTVKDTEQAKTRRVLADTLIACEKFGAYEVRKAAIRQMRGDNKALEEVGLDEHTDEHTDVLTNVLNISDKAFSLMTDEEKFDDFKRHFP